VIGLGVENAEHQKIPVGNPVLHQVMLHIREQASTPDDTDLTSEDGLRSTGGSSVCSRYRLEVIAIAT
jgi:hypothetical protein